MHQHFALRYLFPLLLRLSCSSRLYTYRHCNVLRKTRAFPWLLVAFLSWSIDYSVQTLRVAGFSRRQEMVCTTAFSLALSHPLSHPLSLTLSLFLSLSGQVQKMRSYLVCIDLAFCYTSWSTLASRRDRWHDGIHGRPSAMHELEYGLSRASLDRLDLLHYGEYGPTFLSNNYYRCNDGKTWRAGVCATEPRWYEHVLCILVPLATGCGDLLLNVSNKRY